MYDMPVFPYFCSKADSYGNEKLIRKWTKSAFFRFFQSYGNENGPGSYSQIRLSVSYKRIGCPDSFAPAIQNCKRISHAAQLLLHLANNTARTQLHITSARNVAAIAKGMVELRSIVF